VLNAAELLNRRARASPRGSVATELGGEGFGEESDRSRRAFQPDPSMRKFPRSARGQEPGPRLECRLDGEVGGLLEDGRLHEVPSGDGRRGGDLELWFHLRPGGSGGIGQGGIVLAMPAGSSLLTSKAKQRAIPAAISAVLPRDALAAAIPGDVALDPKAEMAPDRARKLISRQRLGEPGTVPTVTLAVEEPLAGAGELVKTALEQHDVPLQAKVEPVASDELSGRMAEGRATARPDPGHSRDARRDRVQQPGQHRRRRHDDSLRNA
jgi:hypothetical protein